MKKIGCEEHTGVRGERGGLLGGRWGLDGADLEKRLRDMDEAGLDMQVLSGGSSGDVRRDNERLVEVVNKYPR